MHRRARIALIPLIALGLAAPATAGGGDNIASVINRDDNRHRTDVEFSITKQRDGVIDNLNQAEAYSSCERCSSTAIAFQVVLASGTISEVRPVNVAAAVNERCEACVSYAGARQFVRVTRSPLRLTDDGEEQLEDVKDALRRLARSRKSAEQLGADVDEQWAIVKRTLDAELVSRDKDADEYDDADDDDD